MHSPAKYVKYLIYYFVHTSSTKLIAFRTVITCVFLVLAYTTSRMVEHNDLKAAIYDFALGMHDFH